LNNCDTPEDDDFRRAGGQSSDRSNTGRSSRSNNHGTLEDNDFHHASGSNSDRSNGGCPSRPNNRETPEDNMDIGSSSNGLDAGRSNTHTGVTKRVHGEVDGPDAEGEDGHGEKRGRGAKRKLPTRRKR
jgi:hypothetical protein